VINKPAGISSLSEHGNTALSVFEVMKQEEPHARLCHRLDKFTSGCMIVSAHDDAYRHVSLAFEHREIRKVYHAVVHGASALQGEVVDVPLVKKRNNTGIVAREGKPALTTFTTLESFGHYSLIECFPSTGRFHQIRIHLAHLGFPIVADTLYGGQLPYLSALVRRYKPSGRDENPMIQRQALHAFSLGFTGPSGQEIKAIAPYPPDLHTLVKLLRKNDPAPTALPKDRNQWAFPSGQING
jgi:23S rRNA pseudouridine955/2504/2580 synthase